MNAMSGFDLKDGQDAVLAVEAAMLPDAPLAMPVQRLEGFHPLMRLRAIFGFAGRTVKD